MHETPTQYLVSAVHDEARGRGGHDGVRGVGARTVEESPQRNRFHGHDAGHTNASGVRVPASAVGTTAQLAKRGVPVGNGNGARVGRVAHVVGQKAAANEGGYQKAALPIGGLAAAQREGVAASALADGRSIVGCETESEPARARRADHRTVEHDESVVIEVAGLESRNDSPKALIKVLERRQVLVALGNVARVAPRGVGSVGPAVRQDEVGVSRGSLQRCVRNLQ